MAALAALFAVSSCSTADDDALTGLQEQQGKPFSLVVNTGDVTRFTTVGTDDLNYVQLTAVKHSDASVSWFSNVLFSKSGDAWSTTNTDAASWPDESTAYDFYAYSENASAATGNVSAFTTESLTYALPIAATKQHLLFFDEETGDPLTEATYDVVDITGTKDLLVGTTANVTSATADGAVALTLNHALARLEISARLTTTDNTLPAAQQITGVDPTDVCSINYIGIHGLKTAGTYDFSTGQWTATGDAGCYYFVPENAEITTQDNGKTNGSLTDAITTWTLATGANALPLIPQTYTPWDPSATDDELQIADGYADDAGMVYIEINCNFSGAHNLSYGTINRSCYLPLNLNNGTIQPGHRYRLRLDLSKIKGPSGANIFTAAAMGG